METKEILDFLIDMEALKKSKRFSTKHESVRDSTADHTWKMSLMGFKIAEAFDIKDLDMIKVLKLIITHDIPEYAEGDIDSMLVRLGKVTKDEKRAIEEKVMFNLKEKYPFCEDLSELWNEFEENLTREAKYVKAIDKLETLSHVIKEKDKFDNKTETDILHTATYADKAVSEFPELKPLLKEIKKEIKKFSEESGLEWKPEFDLV